MRRIALAVVLSLMLATPLTVEAQQAGKVPRLGILWPYSSSIAAPFAEAFRQGLRDAGYVEGRNILVEERWAEGSFDRLPSLAADLVGRKVDILLVASTPAVQAAQQATVAAASYTPTDPRNDPGRRREREAKARREGAELAGQRTDRLAALEAQPQTVPAGKRTAEEVR